MGEGQGATNSRILDGPYVGATFHTLQYMDLFDNSIITYYGKILRVKYLCSTDILQQIDISLRQNGSFSVSYKFSHINY